MTSLRARIFGAVALAVLISVGLTLLLGAVLVRRSAEQSALEELGRQADLLAARERSVPSRRTQVRGLNRLLSAGDVRLGIFPLERAAAFLPAEAVGDLRAGTGADGEAPVEDEDVLFAARPVDGDVLVLVRSGSLEAADWRPFVGSFLIAGLVGAGIAALVAFALARRIAGPVRRVANASRALAAGDAPASIPVEDTDELALLARSFNHMALELHRAREAERAFLLSVSHELKTPLAAIRGYAEGLADGAVTAGEAAEIVEREAIRLERLVRDLLDLARLRQRAFSIKREPVDLAQIARDLVVRYEPQARAVGIDLVARAPAASPAIGDADRILQIGSNLVENALRSTPAEGSVSISSSEGLLVVEDTGPGIASEDLPHTFERFFLYARYEGERPVGSGLGLAIVEELAHAMHGSVEVKSEPGEGTRFLVRLPVTPATDGTDEPDRPGGDYPALTQAE